MTSSLKLLTKTSPMRNTKPRSNSSNSRVERRNIANLILREIIKTKRVDLQTKKSAKNRMIKLVKSSTSRVGSLIRISAMEYSKTYSNSNSLMNNLVARFLKIKE